ncbi:acyltransferase [Shimia sp. SDUM112013]|uniref:acyltransferase family protein n=1 Tax=Shimia sp. SDUM112013 TaxID=3136160 RepID=UPI0032EF410A
MTDTADAKQPLAMGHESASRFRAYRSVSYFQNLNGLRFICIAMVLWHHAQPVQSETWPILDRGFLGVDFFFVLSGFLITTLLLRERDRTGRFSLRHFYIRRALRILPVYFFVVTLVAAYFIGIKGETRYFTQLPYYYLFLSNFLTDHIPTLSITWSLSVEEQYYLLWPLALLLLPSRWVVPVLGVLIALNVTAAMGLFGVTPPQLGPLTFKLPVATYAPILMGSLAAVLLNSQRGYAAFDTVLGKPLAPWVCAVLLAITIQITPFDLRGLPNLLIHVLMTATLITLVLYEDTVWSPFLTHPFIARVGEVSYGIYLYHLLALHVVHALGIANGWLILIAYSLISVLIAEVSFRTLERWFLNKRPAPAG